MSRKKWNEIETEIETEWAKRRRNEKQNAIDQNNYKSRIAEKWNEKNETGENRTCFWEHDVVSSNTTALEITSDKTNIEKNRNEINGWITKNLERWLNEKSFGSFQVQETKYWNFCSIIFVFIHFDFVFFVFVFSSDDRLENLEAHFFNGKIKQFV